ncbi:MAG: polysaccharide biosynthesis protein [Clostridia bacterium]|nr:polysaccharide biosynthesis protein [Clostridia bacterium]
MKINKVVFIKNAIILTVTGIIIRFIGVFFKVWLAAAVGAEGIGLYQQIFSVYVLVSTFATSGLGIAVTRLVSDEAVLGSRRGIEKILRRCITVSLAIAVFSAAVVYFGSEFIATTLISDFRAAPSLRILSFSLPFMAVSACVKGYFIARKKTAPSSSAQIIEQIIRIAVIVFLIKSRASAGLEEACKAVLFGDTIAEICSCLYVYLLYLKDRKKLDVLKGRKAPDFSILKKLRHIALPIASGRYLNSLLRTTENILVPQNLEKAGLSSSDALSKFGMIKGMVLPLVFFPASFLNALATLLIPEMSESAAAGKDYKVKYTAEKCIHITLIFSIPFAPLFFFASHRLGRLVYGDSQVGGMIMALAPLVPLMYLDSVSDGLLKGLDEQIVTFRNSIFDSLGRLILILLILPFFGLNGFVFIMYLSNIFTCFANVSRLIKVSKAQIKPFKWMVLPIFSASVTAFLADGVLRRFNPSDLVYIMSLSLSVLSIYAVVCLAFSCVSAQDFR